MSTSMLGGNMTFLCLDDIVRGCPGKRALSRAILVEVGTRGWVTLRVEEF